MPHLVLIGAGASNLLLVRALALARNPLPQLKISCITDNTQVLNPLLLPGLMGGHLPLSECYLPTTRIFEQWGVEWIPGKVKAIHAGHKNIQLHDESTIAFDWLAMNSTPQQYRLTIEKQIPGAKEYGFFVYPMELFASHWEQVCQQAANASLRISVLRISVLGNSLRSMEIALAVRQRLPSAAVTWITPNSHSGPESDAAAYSGLLSAFKKQRIHVLHDQVLSIHATALQLQCGAQLATDVPIVALEPRAPDWVAEHPHSVIFQSPDSVAFAPAYQCISGKALSSWSVAQQVQTFYSGASRAVAQWGQYCVEGRLAGWLKSQQDKLGGLHPH